MRHKWSSVSSVHRVEDCHRRKATATASNVSFDQICYDLTFFSGSSLNPVEKWGLMPEWVGFGAELDPERLSVQHLTQGEVPRLYIPPV